jgi:hypothetical protein
MRWGQQSANSHPGDAPASPAHPFDARAKRLAGLARAHDVVAFQKARDIGDALAKQAEDESAMRNRLIARRAGCAP